jgi:SAM-dependent methyltransferase
MLTAAPQPYWDQLYAERPLQYDEESVLFKDVFERYLPRRGSCFEVGCYPGGFLIYLGSRFGYTVNGIDATPDVNVRLPAFIEQHGVGVGTFLHGDFFSSAIEELFDVVCSFGFIEHFHDPEAVIRRHCALVAPGGTLIITCPNFRRVQWLLHRWLDPVNLSRHVLTAMNLKRWNGVLRQLGFEVVHSGYYRTFDFWTEDMIQHPVNQFAKRLILRYGHALDRRINLPTSWLSPYMVTVARRTRNSAK